jgi:hypothetical protein
MKRTRSPGPGPSTNRHKGPPEVVVSDRRWRKPKDGYKTGVTEWSSIGTGKHRQYSGLSDSDRELMRLQTQAWAIRKGRGPE